MMPPIVEDPELLQAFLVESQELLDGVDRDLIKLETNPEDRDLLNQTFRALHSIKGTAGFLGLEPIVRVGHRAEDVLSGLRQGRLKLTRRVMDGLLTARDQLGTMLGDLRAGGLKQYELDPLLAELEALQRDQSKTDGSGNGTAPLASELAHKSVKAKDPGVSAEAHVASVQSMRVDVRKLDELIALVGELVLERNRLLRLAKEASRLEMQNADSPLMHCASRLSFITDELQAAGLRTRMVPIETVFAKFPRMVRDLAHSLGKEADLVVRGEDTEIDKTMVELVSDPLVHLVRNALDHGLELPEAREKANKPRRGRICLQAEHEGDHVLIRITDDGAGINRARVARKGVEKGLISEEQAARLNTREVHELLFLPGFSTVDNPTDISGRGVGMDVVRSNLKKINGSIELDSIPGKGTTINLRVPLTLAIMPVLLVRVAGEVYALPLRSIEQTARFTCNDVHQVEEQEVIWMNGETLPLLRLQGLFSGEQGGRWLKDRKLSSSKRRKDGWHYWWTACLARSPP